MNAFPDSHAIGRTKKFVLRLLTLLIMAPFIGALILTEFLMGLLAEELVIIAETFTVHLLSQTDYKSQRLCWKLLLEDFRAFHLLLSDTKITNHST